MSEGWPCHEEKPRVFRAQGMDQVWYGRSNEKGAWGTNDKVPSRLDSEIRLVLP